MLLVRFLALGDVLLTVPIAEALSRSRLVASVDLMTCQEFASPFRLTGCFRRVIPVDPAAAAAAVDAGTWRYDVVVDLHSRAVPLPGSLEAVVDRVRAGARRGYASPGAPDHHELEPRRRDEHAVEFYGRSVADLMGGPPGAGRITIAERDVDLARKRLPSRAVCIAPGARYPWKRWPASRVAELARILTAAGLSPVLIGHPFDRAAVDEAAEGSDTPCYLEPDLLRLGAAMQASGIVVANNSGLAHLASAAGARVVCVHSHTLPVMWHPWGAGHVDLTGSQEDMPCTCQGPTAGDLAIPCGRAVPPSLVADAVLRISLPVDDA